MVPHFPAADLKRFDTPQEALDHLIYLYQQSVAAIEEGFTCVKERRFKDINVKHATYPFVGIAIEPAHIRMSHYASMSYGFVTEPGLYGSTITNPILFYHYLIEQLTQLKAAHNVPFYVGRSDVAIPMPFVIDHARGQFDEEQLWYIKHQFVQPNLNRINDDVPNGTSTQNGTIRPLALFEAERVDFSLHRLQHYTGTACEHFQSFILLTNYQRYVDEFIAYSRSLMEADASYEALIGPGNTVIMSREDLHSPVSLPTDLPQMPAYHLKHKDGQGITFVNIGVGPSNAKTITDHLAVLRPHCWIMVGHCAGLRSTQILGDYVLAHSYVREDNVLTQDLPAWIPIPPIAEVQVALQHAAENILHQREHDVKEHMRTGTVVSTDNRNWELRSQELYQRFRQSRAIAVDMESATIAGNGFRLRVPYGTLLCVSDKPIHGEIKLPGMANAFYRARVHQHLLIGLEAIRLLREDGADNLHSRKLRGFDELPFR